MPAILSYISRRLMALGTHLTTVCSSGINVNADLHWFHRTVDRLILVGSVLTAHCPRIDFDHHHLHCFDDIPNSASYRVVDVTGRWMEQIARNWRFHQCMIKAVQAARHLEMLDQRMTKYLLRQIGERHDDRV